MTAKVILNPYAGRWMALRRRQEAEEALKAACIDYELATTNGPGHGVELAAQAVRQGFSPIIAAGGDGTISEVVNGMAQAAEEAGLTQLPPLGILPLGSADDLVDNLKLPRDLAWAAKLVAEGKTRLLDLCQVRWQSSTASGVRYFDNNSAIGLEPFITLIQMGMRYVYGNTRYILATLWGVIQKPEWIMKIEWQGGEYHGPVSLVTVGNNPRTGGVFYVTPHADPGDGLLTFVYGYLPTRRKILQVLPRLMKPGEGNYVEHPAIHEVHSPWIRIHSESPTPLHADGELQSRDVLTLEYRVLPDRLPVFTS